MVPRGSSQVKHFTAFKFNVDYITNNICILYCSPSLGNRTISVTCRTRSRTDNPAWIKVQWQKIKFPWDNISNLLSAYYHNTAINSWFETQNFLDHGITLMTFLLLTFVNYRWKTNINSIQITIFYSAIVSLNQVRLTRFAYISL